MARDNRHYLPRQVEHISHRCHKSENRLIKGPPIILSGKKMLTAPISRAKSSGSEKEERRAKEENSVDTYNVIHYN